MVKKKQQNAAAKQTGQTGRAPIKEPRKRAGVAAKVIVDRLEEESKQEGKDDGSEGVNNDDSNVGVESVGEEEQEIDHGDNPVDSFRGPNVERRLEKSYNSLSEERESLCK
jgi:hypothetical protein